MRIKRCQRGALRGPGHASILNIYFILTGCASYLPPQEIAEKEARAVHDVELGGLDAEQEARVHQILADEVCPCGEPHSLADCRSLHRCSGSRPAARFVVRLIREGKQDAEVRAAVTGRFSSEAAAIEVGQAAVLGNPQAPVVLVEFSDFQCPYCRSFGPELKKAIEASGGKARLYFLHYPLSRHEHAHECARAAIAAQAQDKFWEMHDAIFDDQEQLTREDLERRAKELGLDFDRFTKDLDSEETHGRVASDKEQGSGLGVNGTPTIFVNGRVYTGDRRVAEIVGWIRDEAP